MGLYVLVLQTAMCVAVTRVCSAAPRPLVAVPTSAAVLQDMSQWVKGEYCPHHGEPIGGLCILTPVTHIYKL